MNEAENDTPGWVRLSDGLGPAPKRDGFDEYAFLADLDTTRSTCGGRAGKYASEVTQRTYMVWADQQREIERLRAALTLAANRLDVLALAHEYGTTRRNLTDDWAKEAAEALRA